MAPSHPIGARRFASGLPPESVDLQNSLAVVATEKMHQRGRRALLVGGQLRLVVSIPGGQMSRGLLEGVIQVTKVAGVRAIRLDGGGHRRAGDRVRATRLEDSINRVWHVNLLGF